MGGKEVSKLRFRLPRDKPIDGKCVLDRRFLASEPLQIVFNYLASKGFLVTDYKVLSTFPKRDITELEKSKTLKECKFYPQEALTIEERDPEEMELQRKEDEKDEQEKTTPAILQDEPREEHEEGKDVSKLRFR